MSFTAASLPQIGVIDHRRGVEQHLEHQYRSGWHPEHRYCRELDHHRQQDFDRTSARPVVASMSASA
ncbi:MAG: hypothetical protein IT521_07115 [Burkholderiales bacterium]|nr:hypothetical protein [Burkholderiales bacterium]